MSHVFISYSKQNKVYAGKLAEHLISQGFDVWIDDQIEPSDEWFKRIVKGVRECAAFLVIMTPESGASRWVEREVMLADELQKPMFPVLLSGDLHTCELWALFFGKQYEDVRGDKLPGDRFYAKLAVSAPRKAVNPPSSASEKATLEDIWDGWMPKFDDPAPEANISDAKIANFTKMHQTFLEERRAQEATQPPDVSHILPAPFEWCNIHAGKVTIEYSDTEHKTFDVPQFWMAKYPITNAQYQVFVDEEGGYYDPKWWEFSTEAALWRRNNKLAWKTGFEGVDLPRTNVTWYEAVAFCRWLSFKLPIRTPVVGELLGESLATHENLISLPTEQQWQRAAQGDDSRMYPWGDTFDPKRCNTRELGNKKPTSVHSYPEGVSPFGVFDLSGNVWEKCLDTYESHHTNIKSTKARVLRGGSWSSSQELAIVNYRHKFVPDLADFSQGFRLCAISTVK